MSRKYEVITLLSSDEESPSTEDVTPISVKKEEPIKLKESARKSINIRKDISAIKSSESSTSNSHNSRMPSTVSLTTNNNPSLNHTNPHSSSNVFSTSKSSASKMLSNVSPITNNSPVLNHANATIHKKISQTARKSISSPQPSQKISLKSNNNNHAIKTIILNEKKLQEIKISSLCKLLEKPISKSKDPPITNKLSIESNGKTATILSNCSYKELPLVDKLKERGISINPSGANPVNLLTEKVAKSNSSVKNDGKNLGEFSMSSQLNSKLHNLKLLNGMQKDISENKETSSNNLMFNKNNHSPTKYDKDLSWSKKKNTNNKLESQSIRKASINRKSTTSNESSSGGKLSMERSSDPGNRIDDILSPRSIIVVSPSGTAVQKNKFDEESGISVIDVDDSSKTTISIGTGSSAMLKVSKPCVSEVGKTKSACSLLNDANARSILTSQPLPVLEKVQKYLSDAVKEPEASAPQAKQVTSPKLSLKRKKQEDTEIISSTAKKGLFESEKSQKEVTKESPRQRNTSTPTTKHHVQGNSVFPGNPISLEIKDKISSTLRESDTVHRAFDLQKESINLPGPSHNTSSIESNKEKFNKLMDICMESSVWNFDEKLKLKAIMLKKLQNTSESFVSSPSFSNLIDTTLANIRERPQKINTHLNELREKLKLHRNKPSHKQLQIESQSELKQNLFSADSGFLDHNFIKQTTLEHSSQPASTNSCKKIEESFKVDKEVKTLNIQPKSQLSPKEAQRKLDEKILKLEKHLSKLDKKIKELQAKELSLDDLDDEDSTYILEGKYKKKFNETYKILCKLRSCPTRLNFETEKRYSFNGTRYQEINRAVENFINKRKKIEKFPSYVDIFNLVKNSNDSVSLGIKESEYSILAREIFEEVGTDLKQRRQKDEELTFGCYLTDDIKWDEDPAEKDEELKLKLTNSVIEGEQKLKEIIEKFASQQEAKEVDSEESDASLEPEYNEDDDNLPSTNPATPLTGVPDEPMSPLNITQKREIPVVEVGSDSDASTDPGFHIVNNLSNLDQAETKSTKNCFDYLPPPKCIYGENDSSSDLPDL